MAIKNSFLKELRYAHDLQDYESVWGLVVCNWNWDDLKFLRNRFSRIICDSINDDGIRRVGRGFRNLGNLLPIQLQLEMKVDRLNFKKNLPIRQVGHRKMLVRMQRCPRQVGWCWSRPSTEKPFRAERLRRISSSWTGSMLECHPFEPSIRQIGWHPHRLCCQRPGLGRRPFAGPKQSGYHLR